MSQRGAQTTPVNRDGRGDWNMNTDVLEGLEPRAPAGSAAASGGAEATDAATRYLNRMRVLHRKAVKSGEIEDFVAALTRTLAWIAFAHDSPAVTGDILRRIGVYLEEFAQREQAQRELEDLRKSGGQAS